MSLYPFHGAWPDLAKPGPARPGLAKPGLTWPGRSLVCHFTILDQSARFNWQFAIWLSVISGVQIDFDEVVRSFI